MINKALIIAAGNGSRLRKSEKCLPKPLQKVAGLPLIKRIILSSKRAGITEFVIVVGYRKGEIIKALKKENLGVKLTFVDNPDWTKPNGLSVLAAKKYLRENFVLLMSDHIFDVKTLEKFRQISLGSNKTVLAVDHKLDSIFDMDDATKVLQSKGQIQNIGKEIKDFNAIDTGMFLASPVLFEVLEKMAKEGKYSLSDSIQYLASQNLMGTYDIGDGFWQDVDTKECKKHAEKILFQACRKSTDGFISRNLNRHISLFISRLLIKTNLSANHVTGFTTLVGILSGVFVSRGDYWNVVLGALLFKFSSILDGCDGEISKLKLTDSKLGQWLDTLSDNFTYVCFFIGTVIGVAHQGNPYVNILGPLAIFGLAMTLLFMFVYLIRNTNSGSLLAIQKDFKNSTEGGFLKKFFSSIQFMAKRDFFAISFLVIAIFGRLDIILWLCAFATNVLWMVLLSTKLGLFKPSGVLSKESADVASR